MASATRTFCAGLKNHLKALRPLSRILKMTMKRIFVKYNICGYRINVAKEGCW